MYPFEVLLSVPQGEPFESRNHHWQHSASPAEMMCPKVAERVLITAGLESA